MERRCPECGDPLTPLEERDEMVPAGGTYMCSSCQLAYRVDATNDLVELDP